MDTLCDTIPQPPSEEFEVNIKYSIYHMPTPIDNWRSHIESDPVMEVLLIDYDSIKNA